jgi:TolB protein
MRNRILIITLLTIILILGVVLPFRLMNISNTDNRTQTSSTISEPVVDKTNHINTTQTPAFSNNQDQEFIKPEIADYKIAYTVKGSFQNEIYVIDSTGNNMEKLTTGSGADWSPDGNKIIFSDLNRSSWYSRREQIYMLDIKTNVIESLTKSDGDSFYPVWSPNNTKIAFVSNRNDKPFLGNVPGQVDSLGIYVMDTDGSNQKRLSPYISNDSEPDWSSDGKKLIFTSTNNNNVDIYAINIDGSNRRRLTVDEKKEFSPVWSPDGTKIAYIAYDSDQEVINFNSTFPSFSYGNNNIYLMNSDGSNQQKLTSSYNARKFTWSPDGTEIIVLTGNNYSETCDLYIIKADGTMVRKLVSNAFYENKPSCIAQ